MSPIANFSLRFCVMLFLANTIIGQLFAGQFTIAASPTTQSIWQGQAANYSLNVAVDNTFNGQIALAATDLPSGITAAINPATVSGNATPTLTLTVSPAASLGTYSIGVTAVSGSETESATVSVNVITPPPIQYTYDALGRVTSVTDQYGRSAIYTYDAVGNLLSINRPSIAQVSIVAFSPAHGLVGSTVMISGSGFDSDPSQNTVSFNGAITVATAATATQLTVTVPSQATSGPISVSNAGGSATSNATFVVDSSSGQVSDFALTANPSTISTVAGTEADYLINASTLDGFTNPIALAINNLPSGFSASFDSSSLTPPGTTLLRVVAPSNTANGQYTFQVAGTSGTLAHTLSLALVVGSTSADFSLSIAPTNQTTTVNSQVVYTFGVNFGSTTAAPVLLSIAGLPTGAQASFSNTSLNSSGTVSATITTGPSTYARTYPLVFIAQSGSITHSVSASLTITVPDFSIGLNPTGFAFPISGGTQTGTVTMSAVNGFSETATLGVSGLPAGATASFNPPAISPGNSSILSITFPAGSVIAEYFPTLTASLTDPGNGPYEHTVPFAVGVYGIGTVPSGWTQADIGSPQIPSHSWWNAGNFTVQTFGGQVGGTNDQLGFAYNTIQGDGAIIARIDAQNSAASSQAGLMIRDGLDAGATNVFLFVQGGNVYLTDRPSAQSATQSAGNVTASIPQWLELVRQGDTFSAFTSVDGVNWSQLATSVTVQMNSTVSVGLAVTANGNSQLVEAIFDNVAVSSGMLFGLTPASKVVTSTPGGTASTNIQQLAIGFTDTVNYTASGVPSGVSVAFSPASIAGEGSTTVTFTVANGTAPGVYPIVVTGTGATTGLTQSITITLIVQSSGGALAPGWVNQDIGGPSPAGSASYGGGAFTLQGSGAGLGAESWGNYYDQFQFVYSGLQGDGTLIARLVTSNAGLAGIMVRDGFSSDASHVALEAQNATGATLLYRNGANTSESNGGSGGSATPEWLKLVRQGDNFSAFTSADGVNWMQLGSTITVPMSTSVYAGLWASCGGCAQGVTTASFDNVSISGPVVNFSLSSPSAGATTLAGAAVSATVVQTALGGFTDTVNYTASGVPSGVSVAFSPASIAGEGSTTVTFTANSGAVVGTSTVSVNATDSVTNVTQSLSITLTGPDFRVSAAPATETVAPGGTASFTLSFQSINGFAGTVTTSVSGAPSGISATPVSTTVAGAATTSIAVSVASNVQDGTYPINIIAADGPLTHSVPVTVVVNSALRNFQYVRALTISHALVPNTDQTNFPVLFSGVFPFLATTANGGHVQSTSGYDIIFAADAEGTQKLNWEVESYDATTGTAIYWIQVPTLSHTSDTTIYMFYGNAAITTDQSNQSGTWDSNYAAVYHFAGALSTNDSTANGNNAVNEGANSATGEIGNGVSIGGNTSSYVSVPFNQTLQPGNITLEGWINPNGTGNWWSMLEMDYVASGWNEPYQSFALGYYAGSPNFQFNVAGTDGVRHNLVSNGTVNPGSWTHVAATYDGANLHLYFNGVADSATLAYSGAIGYANNSSLSIGLNSTSQGDNGLSGIYDEIRVSSIARSADWIATEYNNQSNPGAFYVIGQESTPGGAIPVGDFSLSSSPSTLRVTEGGTGGVSITEAIRGGFSDTVSFSLTGLPSGVTASFSPASLSGPGTTALTLTVGANVQPGTYEGSIIGTDTSTGYTHSAPVALTVLVSVQSAGFQYVRTITIDHTQVPNSDQINFPILISGTYTYLATTANGGKVQNANGYDIVFAADSAGVQRLNHEIESYSATDGTIQMWVQIPTLSHTTDTTIYMFYGSSVITSTQENRTGVWDSNYAAVYHFAGALSTNDSTANGNNAVNEGANSATGEIGNGASIGGNTSSYLSAPFSQTLQPGNITLEGWINPNATGNWWSMLEMDYVASGWNEPYQSFALGYYAGSQNFQFNVAGTDGVRHNLVSNGTVNPGSWTHVAATYDGANLHLYFNGVADSATLAYSGAIGYANNSSLSIGLNSTSQGYNGLSGIYDEIRVSSIARSPDWIAAEYNNQSNPSSFITVGAEGPANGS